MRRNHIFSPPPKIRWYNCNSYLVISSTVFTRIQLRLIFSLEGKTFKCFRFALNVSSQIAHFHDQLIQSTKNVFFRRCFVHLGQKQCGEIRSNFTLLLWCHEDLALSRDVDEEDVAFSFSEIIQKILHSQIQHKYIISFTSSQ